MSGCLSGSDRTSVIHQDIYDSIDKLSEEDENRYAKIET